jgi:uncharacterized membrane protein YbhN (UPF0104 family)
MGDRLDKQKKAFSINRGVRWAGMLISSVLFLWLLVQQDWTAIFRNLKAVPLWVIPLLLLLYYSGMMLNALRWYILLRAQKLQISFSHVAKIVFIGAFASNFLPSTIGGDAVRIVGAQQVIGNWAVSSASIVVDRLLNVLSMLVTSPLSILTFGPGLFHLFRSFGPIVPVVSVGVFSAPFQRWYGRLKRFWLPFKDSLSLWWNRPLYLALAFFVSWCSIFVIMVAVWWLANLLGIQVALYQVMGVNVITYLLTLIPISFNGYGVREFAIVTLYLQLGASVEQASVLALTTRFFMLLETLPGALWVSQIMPGVPSPGKEENIEKGSGTE